MALGPGTRLGPYEITALLGEGGMGKVYRAHHSALKRDDALKVLPDAFASDPDRLARFRREAQVLASLNHPNIAQIYGFEDAGGVTALVMELVEGPTLAEILAGSGRSAVGSGQNARPSESQEPRAQSRHGLPLDEALPIAMQIAEALEAAHEKGIIHRDLKPANIKVRLDGTVKVLDFGLAKAMEPAAALSPSVSQAPTITTPAMTQAGMILGTAAYMSPEQARGKPVDKRADIWAFGCVLYETLTGARAFPGEDIPEVLASVLARAPDWARLPPTLSPTLVTYIRRCLHKDLRQRIHDIADVRLALEGAFETTAPLAAAHRRPLWRRIVMPVAAAFVASTAVGAGIWFAMRPVPVRVSRLTITPPSATPLTISNNQLNLAITPDGSRLIYVGNRGTQLFVRALDALAPVAVFTGAPFGPFVSPDGRWIGFVDGTTVLKKVAVTGGPAVTLATLDGLPRGATWAPEDTIIFATPSLTTGLQRITAAGGPTTVLTRPDRTQGERDHLWPELLPGGRAVLFTVTALTGGLDAAQVVVLDLQTGTRTVLVRGGSDAHYVRSGHLVYAAAGTLRAVPFDLARLQTRGTPVPVIPDVVTTLSAGVYAVVAGDGTLAYVSGGGAPGAGAQRTLVWVDRQGRETLIPVPSRAYFNPRLSPDGTRVAVATNDQEQDIWVWDTGRTTLTRITSDPGNDREPVWMPDGRRVIFSSGRVSGASNLFWQAADGTGAAEPLTESANAQYASAVSPDSRRLVFTETAPKTGQDVMQLELDGTRRVTPLVQSLSSERNGVVSPDGRWLVYETNASGAFEIFVQPFPDVNSGRWQVSTGGGTQPFWARSGQELFYTSATGQLMRVGVERARSWAATTPTQVVKEGYYGMTSRPSVEVGRQYDVAPDGQRFLMTKEGDGSEQTVASSQIIIVQNWTEELKRLVPTR